MMNDGWVIVPNWEKWQSRKDRNDPWIKTYTDLVHRDEYLNLAPTARALLHGIWLLYSLHDGVLRASRVQSALNLRATRQHWDSLVHAGFIVISAAKPPPIRGLEVEKERRERERPTTTKEEIEDFNRLIHSGSFLREVPRE